MKRYLLLCALFASVAASAQRRIYDEDFQELINRMEGTFDTQEQASKDKDYFNIVLHMKRIWKDRKASRNGYWLYVEQAVATATDKPYRQRIYHIFRKDNETLVSQVFELESPLRFAGAWEDESKLRRLTKDSLSSRVGCDIFLQMNEDGDFWGSTEGKNCISTLKGATYATSEVVIYPNMMVSWDRGWDVNDKQVWGAEKGGYRFRKWTLLRTGAKD